MLKEKIFLLFILGSSTKPVASLMIRSTDIYIQNTGVLQIGTMIQIYAAFTHDELIGKVEMDVPTVLLDSRLN
jgi:hypothetical protein